MKFVLLLLVTITTIHQDARAQWTEVKRLVQEADRNDERSDSLLNAAIRLSKVSLAKDPKNADEELWMANAVGRLAQSKQGMEKLKLSKVVKVHVDKALQLDPKHANAQMTLGAWYFYVADLSFIEKSFMKVLDPDMLNSASYEKAIDHLSKAIDNGVEFKLETYYIRAKAYDGLDQDAKARADSQKVLSFKPRNAKERGYQAEARDWLD